MKIKSTIIALTMASCICFFSCSSPSKESTATYDIGLTESKKITLQTFRSSDLLTLLYYPYI